MAEGLLKDRLPGRSIGSAGVGALIGHPADGFAVEVMHNRGFDISAHVARQASWDVLAPQELILTLDQSHSDALNSRFPQLRGRVHKLLRWRDNADVPDPYRQPVQAFEAAFELIEAGVGDWVRRVG